MKIISPTPELTFSDILLLPGFSTYPITEDSQKTNLQSRVSRNLILNLPICSSPMANITEVDMAIALGKMGGIGFIHCFQPFARQLSQVRSVKREKVKLAVSVSDFTKEGLKHVGNLLKAGADLICLETAQAHNLQTINFLKQVKAKYPTAEVCVSLVVTSEATKDLIEAGADSIRVGIGGGSHCTTRLVTGVGRPQLSAVLACSKVAQKYNVPIISDTGIEHPGDIAKAIAFGASTVMIGGLFAGTLECPGQVVYDHGQPYKFSAGMCSPETEISPSSLPQKFKRESKKILKVLLRRPHLRKFVPTYSQPFNFVHEGVSALIPYKGSVVPVVNDLVGGLRRSLWYLGCENLEQLQKKARVVVVTSNTQKDNVQRIR